MLCGRSGETKLAADSEHSLPVGVGDCTLEEEMIQSLDVTTVYANRTAAPGVAMATFRSVVIPLSEVGEGNRGPAWRGP
ncbi:hypothetical protein MTO96_045984 [Rhipicephalus appendiculatus]